MMACEEYPQLEVSPYLDQLDHMADMAQESLRAGDSPDRDGGKNQHASV